MRRRDWGIALAIATLLAAGCGANAKRAAVTAPRTGAPDRLESRADLLHDLEATVLENYNQLSLNNFDAYVDSSARERELLLIGPGPDDVVFGLGEELIAEARASAGEGAAAYAKFDRRPLRHSDGRLVSKNLELHLSSDGSVGWMFDEVSYRLPFAGRQASIPLRVTGVYVRDIDRWVLAQEHVSYALDTADILQMALRHDPMVASKTMSSRVEATGVPELVRHIVGRVHNGSPRYRARKIASESDTLLLWPDPAEELHGAAAAASPSLAQLFTESGGAAQVSVEAQRIEVARSSRVAWMIALLTVNATVEGTLVTFGLRGSYVLELRDDGWEIVQAHVSVPVSRQELSRRVFGDNVTDEELRRSSALPDSQ